MVVFRSQPRCRCLSRKVSSRYAWLCALRENGHLLFCQINIVAAGKGEVGAAKLAGEVMDIVAKVPEMVSKMTGINLSQVPPNVQSCASYDLVLHLQISKSGR